MTGLLILAGLATAGAATILAANRFAAPPKQSQATFTPAPDPKPAGATLTVTTWNVGYAGMGAEADFVMDLGQQTRPTDPALVDRNLAAVAVEMAAFESDVIFVQEAAEPSYSTHGRDVMAALRRALPSHGWMYGPEVATRFVPPPFRASIGNAIFSRLAAEAAERRALPLEPGFQYGAFRKGYQMHILRLAGPERWVLVNIHLSTFDSAEDDVRGAQVAALMRFARAEYAAGARVVIGGDWNLRIAPTEFPHATEERYRFWIRDFPESATPAGWTWAVDPAIPTVRTAHKPYVAGENYVLVIDGFLVSPNVAVDGVEARDLGFRHSDHNPVTARLRAR